MSENTKAWLSDGTLLVLQLAGLLATVVLQCFVDARLTLMGAS